MIGLYAYGTARKNANAVEAARRASEVFLRRRLYRRVANGKVIHWEFARLHYPLYWHYDFLGGLKAMAAMGQVRDPRCTDALDLLESKELPGGGWRAEGRDLRPSRRAPSTRNRLGPLGRDRARDERLGDGGRARGAPVRRQVRARRLRLRSWARGELGERARL